MKAKILISFIDGKRKFAVGEVIKVNPRAALFLFSSKYGEAADDEAREFCKAKLNAKGPETPAPAATGT